MVPLVATPEPLFPQQWHLRLHSYKTTSNTGLHPLAICAVKSPPQPQLLQQSQLPATNKLPTIYIITTCCLSNTSVQTQPPPLITSWSVDSLYNSLSYANESRSPVTFSLMCVLGQNYAQLCISGLVSNFVEYAKFFNAPFEQFTYPLERI